jgi:hypothetical protein
VTWRRRVDLPRRSCLVGHPRAVISGGRGLWLVVVTGDGAEAAIVRGRRGMVVVVVE